MNAKDRTEDVLKSIHILFSKAEPIEGSKTRVVIDKSRMMNLLKSLNDCMYAMMEEYELTQQSKEKAIRKIQQQSDELVFDARKEADDIYAAAFMYTDHSLDKIQELINKYKEEINLLNKVTMEEMEKRVQTLKDNQLDLKNQLSSLIESQKYLKLIENENIRLKREKEKAEELGEWQEEDVKRVQPEIRINEEFLRDNGISMETDEEIQDVTKLDFSEVLDETENEPKRGFFGRGRKN